MKRRTTLLLAGAVLLGGCSVDLTVPNYNRDSLEGLQNSPTEGAVNTATTGLIIGARADADSYTRTLGIVGREGYFLEPQETRYLSELIAGALDASSFAGGGLFTLPYRNIRNANVVLAAVDKVTMPEASKAGVRGFAKTIQALEYLYLANTREQIPLDVSRPLSEPLAPLAPRAEGYALAIKLLDEGAAELQKAGGSFSFRLSTGFTTFAFDKPAAMLQLNRALRARINAYQGNYAAVLTDLGGSFINTADGSRASLNRGAYHSYSAGSGDQPNLVSDQSGKLVAVPELRRDAQLQASGARDARFLLKVDSGFTRTPLGGVNSDLRFALYTTRPFFGPGGQASPIPIIRNEELILLRAEAKWKTNDLAGAIADLNFVRTNSGGLPARTDITAENFLSALLYERRYSLLQEGGHRYLDMRRFGLLGQFNDYPRVGDRSPEFFPIPTAEALARQGT